METLFYNPFLRVYDSMIRKLIDANKPHIIIQRFEWPGQTAQKTFLMSAYETAQEALSHNSELGTKEGKLLNLLDPPQYETVMKLLKTESGYNVFFNGTIDLRHEKRLQKAYVKSVYAYIQQIRMKKEEQYDVRIFVEHGRLKAQITSGERSHTALFYDMIK
jgi:hypothetical protein